MIKRPNENETTFMLYLPKELKLQAKAVAKNKYNMSLSAVMRQMMKSMVKGANIYNLLNDTREEK